ncbi:hypothetical protein [Streptomyces sp. NPDC006368]|uniref:hypothetical protein n=1 Tax=Streptomyces sp. NPDC006368 TaxID=3156760 RepID=UPI0033A52440
MAEAAEFRVVEIGDAINLELNGVAVDGRFHGTDEDQILIDVDGRGIQRLELASVVAWRYAGATGATVDSTASTN